jgi:CTP:phosphocholine cytidylyltransferase-like protein/thiamine kinase-like enzyme
MTKNDFEILYEIKKNKIRDYRSMSSACNVSMGTLSSHLKELRDKGLINETEITEKGTKELKPYKVDNAIIMAAGLSSRFVPFSLEKPKGLMLVKGEILIERQIQQLKEAGIDDITLVLGYKKESFFYLQNKYGVKIIINGEFHLKNNTETLYLARNELKNTYICSSDDYFAKNPFDQYVYCSYYASIHVKEKTDEWYMKSDSMHRITQITKSGEEGDIMLGHVYWDKDFSKAMSNFLVKHHDIGDYDQTLWEQILLDHVKEFPTMLVKTYPSQDIFEFDSLDELRKFDDQYIYHTGSKIIANISLYFKCEEKDVKNFKPINEGLTNTSFIFEVFGKKYVYRHPGDGTEKIINRNHEKQALELAKKINVDPTFITMNANEGWKISTYIPGIRQPDYKSFEDTIRVTKVMRQLHDQNLQVDWSFDPWAGAMEMEELILKKQPIDMPDYEELKSKVKAVYEKTIGDGVKKRFCHCDTYAPNWMLTNDKTILIDWEYAGEADPGCDLAGYIMDAMYDYDDTVKFIKCYCGSDYNDFLCFHYMAYVALVSFYWFVWAMYRESCGAVMHESLHNWYVMAKRFSNILFDRINNKK